MTDLVSSSGYVLTQRWRATARRSRTRNISFQVATDRLLSRPKRRPSARRLRFDLALRTALNASNGESLVNIPDPDHLTPTTRADLTNVVFLKNEVTSEFIEIGDYTYADNGGDPTPFEHRCVKYLYGPQKLRIGRFTTIGPGVTILMPGGNHPMVGPSTYPFTMFGGDWTNATMDTFLSIAQQGDTVIGHDVWIGRDATILPGITIGDGAVIGARSVVTRDVGPYQVVAGNPARLIRTRYSDEDIALLRTVAWWDWPVDVITQYAATIMGGTPQELANLAPDSCE